MAKTFGTPEFTIPAGEDWERTFAKTVTESGAIIDITGLEYKFSVKENKWDADEDSLIELGSSGAGNDSGGSLLAGLVVSGSAGKVVATLAGSVTVGMSHPGAWYDFWEKEIGGDWKLQARNSIDIVLNISPMA